MNLSELKRLSTPRLLAHYRSQRKAAHLYLAGHPDDQEAAEVFRARLKTIKDLLDRREHLP